MFGRLCNLRMIQDIPHYLKVGSLICPSQLCHILSLPNRFQDINTAPFVVHSVNELTKSIVKKIIAFESTIGIFR